jgi:hypothetical protein
VEGANDDMQEKGELSIASPCVGLGGGDLYFWSCVLCSAAAVRPVKNGPGLETAATYSIS